VANSSERFVYVSQVRNLTTLSQVLVTITGIVLNCHQLPNASVSFVVSVYPFQSEYAVLEEPKIESQAISSES
jgi:hypothetical protein